MFCGKGIYAAERQFNMQFYMKHLQVILYLLEDCSILCRCVLGFNASFYYYIGYITTFLTFDK